MSIEDRINTLRNRHANLEVKLDSETARPLPNDDALRSLKHEKLVIKDEIERMQQAL